MQAKSIFERELAGEIIALTDPEYYKIDEIQVESQKIIAELNTGYHGKDEIRALFARLTGAQVSDDFWLMPPFYTDFGRNIRVGKRVFVNHGCEFMDRGGITIEDDVLIGPRANLLTTSHPLDPIARRGTISTPITIKRNAFIGAGATITPGVTIGENAVISAGAVVTKDVPPDVVVAGNPARVIRQIVPEQNA